MRPSFVLGVAMLAAVALAGSPPCNCGHGTVQQAQPSCVCTCATGYQPPRCKYTETTTGVRMEIWFGFTLNEFVSDRYARALQAQLGEPVSFVYSYNGNYNTTIGAVFETTGRGVFNTMAAVEAATPPAWVSDLRIIEAYDVALTGAPPEALQEIPLVDTNTIVVTLNSMLYVIGLVVCLIVVLFLDCCCYGANTAEEIKLDLESKTMSLKRPPKEGEHPESKYKDVKH